MRDIHGANAEDAVLAGVEGGLFRIDDEGRIWRLLDRKGRALAKNPRPMVGQRAERLSQGGYLRVFVRVDGISYVACAHRVVYRFFNGPIADGKTINHINGKKADNRPSNLEQATMREQAIHARYVLGSRVLDCYGERHHHASVSDADVTEIRRRRAAGEVLTSIARDYNIAFQTVSKIVCGDRRAMTKRREAPICA